MAWYEAISRMFDPVLTPVFFFILKMPPAWGIVTISLIITLISTFIYKWVTDQSVMKALKADMKGLQKKVKEHSKNKDMAQMNTANKEIMQKNMQYMKQSFKPMIFTMLPLLIIFGWVGGHLAYEPIQPGNEFNVSVDFAKEMTGSAVMTVPDGVELLSEAKQNLAEQRTVWTLKGNEGDYAVQIDYNNQSYEKFVQITDEKRYAPIQKFVQDDNIKIINVENKKVKLFGLSWFWTYLIAAIAFSTLLRKVMKLA